MSVLFYGGVLIAITIFSEIKLQEEIRFVFLLEKENIANELNIDVLYLKMCPGEMFQKTWSNHKK